jgi:hypothetical protein
MILVFLNGMELKMIDSTYLPFTVDDLKQHFLKDADRNLAYYLKSAERYHQFIAENPNLIGIPLKKSKYARQIEKDKRYRGNGEQADQRMRLSGGGQSRRTHGNGVHLRCQSQYRCDNSHEQTLVQSELHL